jgi:hypothetical protein
MATKTTPRRASAAQPGRFARGGTTPRRPAARSSAATSGRFPRPGAASFRRRPPKQSGLKKLVGKVMPAAAAKKAAPGSKTGKAGGLALVAAAAGMAFKNREKLSGLRRSGEPAAVPPATTTPVGDSRPAS